MRRKYNEEKQVSGISKQTRDAMLWTEEVHHNNNSNRQGRHRLPCSWCNFCCLWSFLLILFLFFGRHQFPVFRISFRRSILFGCRVTQPVVVSFFDIRNTRCRYRLLLFRAYLRQIWIVLLRSFFVLQENSISRLSRVDSTFDSVWLARYSLESGVIVSLQQKQATPLLLLFLM